MNEREEGFRANKQGIRIMAPFMNQQTVFLLHLLCLVDTKGVIALNPAIKERLLRQAGSKTATPANTVTQYLTSFCKANIMTATGGGEYRVNPEVATKYKDYTASVLKDSKDYMEFKAQKKEGTSINIVKEEGNNYG